MQRARKAEDKEIRRQGILAAAQQELSHKPFVSVKMADVAKTAALAKGTVFLYFPTKEALFLAVLQDSLTDWLNDLDAGLNRGRGPWTPARVAKLLARTLKPRPTLVRLLTLLSGVLEQNVEIDTLVDFKMFLIERLAKTGGLLERRLDLKEGDGQQLLLRVYAMVIGLMQLCDPTSTAKAAEKQPAIAVLLVDFDQELETSLTALIRGLTPSTP